MKRGDVTAVTFIRNNYVGAFCLFESMATLLPVVQDMVILDLGSDDGTYETLNRIEDANPRVRVERSKFSCVDAKAFADAANDCVALATRPNVLFWQADEIWHQTLLKRMAAEFEKGNYNLSFWRVQYKHNWQTMKWFPHPVHRVGPKEDFVFVNDGMNTDQGRVWGAQLCAEYDGGWFTRWGSSFDNVGRCTVSGLEKEGVTYPPNLPGHDMIMDVSQVGGFIDNIIAKRKLHSPMWHELDMVEGISANQWFMSQRFNREWDRKSTPFDMPHIMRRHLGRRKYVLDDDLEKALMNDTTERLLGL
jgi:hypothetical protein